MVSEISLITSTVLCLLCALIVVPGIEALQCYNCVSMTDFDDSGCLHPNVDGTLVQECQRNDVCEKKLIRIDAYTEQVVRGCSSNCDGREYIWTEDFRVHCCSDDNMCNSAVSQAPVSFLFMLACALLMTYTLL